MTTAVVDTTDTQGAPTSSSTAVPLSSLRHGAHARILAVSEEHSTQLAHRLADLGMEPGRVVEVGRRAPMGDPTVYRVASYSLSLRRRDAALVLVEEIA